MLYRIEFHTPEHASWLNMVEIESGVLRNLCLDCCIADRTTLDRQIAARKTAQQRGGPHYLDVITERVRARLGRAYPVTAKES